MSDPKETKKEIKLPENIPVDYAFERMLKTFLKQVDRDGIIREVKERRYYIKPSDKKRLEQKNRRKR